MKTVVNFIFISRYIKGVLQNHVSCKCGLFTLVVLEGFERSCDHIITQ